MILQVIFRTIYNSLYVKHEITVEDFNNSLSYYINNNIDSLNVIYDDVIENLIKESYKISQWHSLKNQFEYFLILDFISWNSYPWLLIFSLE